MKYEENVWYGWNGGECPVHPETVVEFLTVSNRISHKWFARDVEWVCDGNPVVAFRVTKEHKEPREFWAKEYKVLNIKSCMTVEMNGSKWQECNPTATGATLFREVIQ